MIAVNFFLIPIIYFCSTILAQKPSEDILVKLSTGLIQGYTLKTRQNNQGQVFLGIPYAQPPINELRYMPSVPPKPWNHVLETKKYRPACLQNSPVSPQNLIKEDCLYLNVFASRNCYVNGSCTVIHYLHGGGWSYDSPNMFPPEVLVDNFAARDVIFVLIGYRLGSFGSWTTGTDEAMGNLAFHDIKSTLIWIQKEIHNFGGDPNKVTIMGHSSAAEGITLMTLTPKLKGLFHQAIAMSGASDLPLNSGIPESKNFSISAGCATEISWRLHQYSDILRCLQAKPASELLSLQTRLGEAGINFGSPRFDGTKGFFPSQPAQLEKNRIPYDLLVGSVTREFAPALLPPINVTLSLLTDACQAAILRLGVADVAKETQKCLATYKFDGKSITEQFSQFINDALIFITTMSEAISMYQAGAKVYLYQFDYVKRGLENFGPFHATDLSYVVGIHPFSFDSRDYAIQSIYSKLFANFAKYGNPTAEAVNPEWLSLQNASFNYYSVDLPHPTNRPFYNYPTVEYWIRLLNGKSWGSILTGQRQEVNLIDSNLAQRSGQFVQVAINSDSDTSPFKTHGVSDFGVLVSLFAASACILAVATLTSKYWNRQKIRNGYVQLDNCDEIPE